MSSSGSPGGSACSARPSCTWPTRSTSRTGGATSGLRSRSWSPRSTGYTRPCLPARRSRAVSESLTAVSSCPRLTPRRGESSLLGLELGHTSLDLVQVCSEAEGLVDQPIVLGFGLIGSVPSCLVRGCQLTNELRVYDVDSVLARHFTFPVGSNYAACCPQVRLARRDHARVMHRYAQPGTGWPKRISGNEAADRIVGN